MNTDSTTHNQSPKLETYRNVINGIEFMEKLLDDPEILSPNSSKFKPFLVQSFSYLHPSFYYLSFLNPENLDKEIIKAARILQIVPINSSVNLSDVFQNDKKFWDKFFSLIKNKKEVDSKANSIFDLSLEDKISFFKDIKSTLNYLNYEFLVLKSKKLNKSDIDKEINNWKELAPQTDTNCDKSISFSCDEEPVTDFDIVKLNADLKQIKSMYLNIKLAEKQNEPEHLNFFNNFIFLTKNILEYKKNISIINSTDLDILTAKLLANDDFLENLYFMKKCLKLMKTLKSKPHI